MKKICFVVIMAYYFFTGCAVAPKMYYWENYSSSLYKLKKTPNDENLLAHKKTLIKIIETSNEKGKRVPPGVCCEYGYILMKEGKDEDALKYFKLEEQAYPESKIFIQRIKATIRKEKGE